MSVEKFSFQKKKNREKIVHQGSGSKKKKLLHTYQFSWLSSDFLRERVSEREKDEEEEKKISKGNIERVEDTKKVLMHVSKLL